jgi:signal transduction histidine kinase
VVLDTSLPPSAAASSRLHDGAAHLLHGTAAHLRHGTAIGWPIRRNAGGPAEDWTAGLRPSDRWHFWPGWVDLAWVIFAAANLIAMLIFERWETIPFHFIWITFTLLYGFRVWRPKPTLWVLWIVIVTTFLAIGLDVRRGTEPVDELNEVPLMAAMFWAMVWHARRRLAAERERSRVSEENARLLDIQRRFLQDASHQLRTPITIALGHAELLARDLADRQGQRDIHVVVGELERLKGLGERLLLIAASESPDFLRPEPVALDAFIMEALRRWRPAAQRHWRLGHLDAVTVNADSERLGLAIDALLENAVQHTGPDDVIRMSVQGGDRAAHLIIEDTGDGIPRSELAGIFDRFASGPGARGHHGTGLGLALVRAIALGHGGEVRVRSTPGAGSRFDFMLPVLAPADDGLAQLPIPVQAGDIPVQAGDIPVQAGDPRRIRRP